MIGLSVMHFQHGIGTIIEVVDEELVRVQFDTGVRTISKENLKHDNGIPLVKRPDPVFVISPAKTPRKRVFNPKGVPRVAKLPDSLFTFLAESGVSIRIMAAPEHLERLNHLLASVGSSAPETLEPVAVGERGGVTRPYAPGFISTFKKPPEGITSLRFREEEGGMVSTANTAFALALIQHGFPITTWKGRPDGEGYEDLPGDNRPGVGSTGDVR